MKIKLKIYANYEEVEILVENEEVGEIGLVPNQEMGSLYMGLDETLRLEIDSETGQILNWKKPNIKKAIQKLVDAGSYEEAIEQIKEDMGIADEKEEGFEPDDSGYIESGLRGM